MNNLTPHTRKESGSSISASIILFAVLMAGFATAANAAAQDTDPQPVIAAAPPHAAPPASDGQPAGKQLIKPGDRTCLQSTGRLIPAKKGDCLPVPGRSYSGAELRNTGAIDNAHSLQMLDPSITLGH